MTPSSTCIPDTSLVSGSSSPSSPQLCRTLFTSTPDKATSDGETEVEGGGGEEDEEEEEPPLLKGTISSCPQCSKPVTMDPTVECLLCDGCNTPVVSRAPTLDRFSEVYSADCEAPYRALPFPLRSLTYPIRYIFGAAISDFFRLDYRARDPFENSMEIWRGELPR